METFDFDRIIDRRNTGSLKWDRYHGRDILPLWVADMDFTAPPAVIDALRKRLDHGVFGYTVPPDGLAEQVCGRLKKKYAWTVPSEAIVWLPGVVSGLNLACRSVGEAGDQVATLTPVYPPFFTAPSYSDRRLLTVPLDQMEHGRIAGCQQWGLDMDRFDGAVSEHTALFTLCNPHNPTGRVFSRRELTEMAAVCDRRDIVICSDEIHCELLLDRNKTHRPIASLAPDISRRTITLMAPSKTFNIPGLNCSFAVIENRDLRSRFKACMQGILSGVNTCGYVAALAAFRGGGAWQTALIDYLIGNRDTVEKAILAAEGLKVNHVEATYLAWIDARTLPVASPAAFFEAAGVGLSDGKDFGGEGFLRLNFGCPRSTLNEALTRMFHALEAL